MFHSDLTPFGVDAKRLTRERLHRLQSAMKSHELGALLLTDFLNLRYATNTVMMLGLRATGIQRFAIVPAQGDPVRVGPLHAVRSDIRDSRNRLHESGRAVGVHLHDPEARRGPRRRMRVTAERDRTAQRHEDAVAQWSDHREVRGGSAL